MSWPLQALSRRGFQNADNWGTLLIMAPSGNWEVLSHSYELPWKEDDKGRSKSSASRIVEGVFELHVRSDGPKGWRLELLNTGHRENIQVHRAHKSMYIEGCILPVDFIDFRNEPSSGIGPIEILKKGDAKIERRSIALIKKIKARYDVLKEGKKGNPTIAIWAILPAVYRTTSTAAA
jgi:hypothetical protein